MNPALVEELLAVAKAAEAAGHGGKVAVYADAANRLGISVPTLYARLRAVRLPKPRKRRADAGAHALSREDAYLVAAVVEETRRLTGTGAAPLEQVLAILRANRPGFASRIDEDSGELIPLSASAVRRAMRHHGCHPEQLAQPSPAAKVASPHPNWCWQIDASLSRQYYLAEDGTQVLDQRQFYQGKPGNLARINDRRLWRYVVTDHASGYLYVHYVQGAESTANLLSALIHALSPRSGEAMHGVPHYLVTDPGPGTRSQVFQNFLAVLGIFHILAGEARAKGQVEDGNSIVNTHFEAMLRLRAPVASVAEMNALAADWCRAYNATAVHGRHGQTRRDAWLRITPEQLRMAPSVETLRALAASTPKECTVRDYRIRFRGAVWDVTGLPGVINGAKVEVLFNPYDEDSVRVLQQGADGRPAHFLAPRVQVDSFGFEAGAAIFGQSFQQPAQTPTDVARKEIERLAMQAGTDAEAKAKRKTKALPFGGEIDPLKHIREAVTQLPPALPRAGTPSTVEAPAEVAPVPRVPMTRPNYEPRVLGHVEMARELRHRIEQRGGAWDPGYWARMAALWPNGVTEEQLDACTVQLLRGGLQVVGGGA